MAATYNSGAVDYGSFVVGIQSGAWTSTDQANAANSVPAGLTRILDNVTINRPTTRVDRPNQIGEPNGFVLIPGQVTGSCVIQFPTLVQPEPGQYFVRTFDTSLGAEMFVIESVDTPYAAGDYFKANCTLVKDYNNEGA